MRFVFASDIHISRYNQDKLENTTNLPERLFSINQALEGIIKYCKKEKIQTAIIGGDLLHGKSIIYTTAQSLMLDFFRKYPEINFIIIDGNHDLSGKGKDAVSALKSLDNEPNIDRIKTSYFKDSENDILYVPYSFDMVEIIKNNSAKFLISHFGLDEGVLNSGISLVADIGMKDLIGKYETVLLGHYHKPQEIINEKIKIYYSGSIIQLDWGEKNEEKRFLDVDTETGIIKSIPTTGYVKFLEYNITKENKEEIVKIAREDKKKGNHIKLVRNTSFDIDDITEEFRIVDKVEKDITNRGIDSTMTQSDKFKKYLEIKEIKPEQHEQYLKVAMDIVNSCEGDENENRN